MDVDDLLRGAHSRRTLLHRSGLAAAGGSAAFLAACGSSSGSKGASSSSTSTPAIIPPATGSGDVSVLNAALDLENMAIAAYTAGAPLLNGAVLKLGRQFLAQEKEHAAGLRKAINQAGGTPNQPKTDYGFPAVRSQSDVLRLASMIENTAIGAYIDAIPKLSSGDLRATAASIVTDEAEHLAVLQSALGRDPVPTAFVLGTQGA